MGQNRPIWRRSIKKRPGVGTSADAARTSACATGGLYLLWHGEMREEEARSAGRWA